MYVILVCHILYVYVTSQSCIYYMYVILVSHIVYVYDTSQSYSVRI